MSPDPHHQIAPPVILIVDDEPDFLRGLSRSVPRALNCSILTAESAAQALKLLAQSPVEVLLTDVRMPDMDGMKLLEEVGSTSPWTTVVIMTGYATIDLAVQAIKKGAYDFLQKPFKPDQINRVLEKAIQHNNLIKENIRLKSRLSSMDATTRLVGNSAGIRKVLNAIHTVAALNVTVLLRGESGTGKDLAARYIHMLSPRANLPMVTVNCPAIPESLLESELFGHVKGAFTGAESDRRGLMKEASGSTLFLDEIGDISPTIQTKLLRLIQEKEIKPLGSSSSRSVDVRIIASTNRDLEAKIADGSFREDLFYRLNVVTIRMPQLQEIREDILLLAKHFMKQAASEFGLVPKQISGEAIRYLIDQAWPGNIRQLKNAVQKAMIFSTGTNLQVRDFIEDLQQDPGRELPSAAGPGPYRELRDKLVADFTTQYLLNAMERNAGNISAAARESDLERQHFQQLLRKHDIDPNRFRANRKN